MEWEEQLFFTLPNLYPQQGPCSDRNMNKIDQSKIASEAIHCKDMVKISPFRKDG